MSYANYSEIEHKVADHEAFDSGNRSAVNSPRNTSSAPTRRQSDAGLRDRLPDQQQALLADHESLAVDSQACSANPTIVNDEAALYA